MGRLYNQAHKIRFTSIPETYNVRRVHKGKLSELHSAVVSYALTHFDGTQTFKSKLVLAINILTYSLYAAEPLPFDWSMNAPFTNMPDIDDDLLQETLGDVYLTVECIDWDISIVDDTPVSKLISTESISPKPEVIKTTATFRQIDNTTSSFVSPSTVVINETPSTDLYIQAPDVLQFDYSKPWAQKQCGAHLLTIYTSLPEIPKRQRDISITTDVTRMSDYDLLCLYPNHFVKTRAPMMYTPQTNMDFDPELGVILPIDDYTKEQVADNILRYPHLYKLARAQGGELVSFYAYMEIDGELVDTLKVWDSLPISKWIPKNAEFIKEYIVRKYLLDTEIRGIKYQYPIFGTLDPFLTLFMPAESYTKRGFDAIDLARKCVSSRVSYKQSRSPVLRRILTEDV